jgi:hypothetical protein
MCVALKLRWEPVGLANIDRCIRAVTRLETIWIPSFSRQTLRYCPSIDMLPCSLALFRQPGHDMSSLDIVTADSLLVYLDSSLYQQSSFDTTGGYA